MGALKYWIWLTTLTKVAGTQAYPLLRHFGSPEAAYAADEGAYSLVPNLSASVREALKRQISCPGRADSGPLRGAYHSGLDLTGYGVPGTAPPN